LLGFLGTAQYMYPSSMSGTYTLMDVSDFDDDD
jgi:hypothetical protein